MTKLSRKKTDPEKFGHYVNNLWSAFTLMDSKEDVRLLMKDLLTHTEYKMLSKRLEIARRLMAGETYEVIEKELQVTSNPVTRINNIIAEKGEGLRKAHQKLAVLEQKYLKAEQVRVKNLSNPFRRKIRRKTPLGVILKAGVLYADRKIRKSIKERSAAKQLEI